MTLNHIPFELFWRRQSTVQQSPVVKSKEFLQGLTYRVLLQDYSTLMQIDRANKRLLFVCVRSAEATVAAKSAFRALLERLRRLTAFGTSDQGEAARKKAPASEPTPQPPPPQQQQRRKSSAREPIEWIKDIDDNFFENFTALSWQRENRRLQVARQEEGERERPAPEETELPPAEKYIIGKKEWEELYVEVLYTIRHKLGASSSGYAAFTQDLYDYAQEAFRMLPQQHAQHMAVAQHEKPPIPVLNATVVEAQGLEAKDPNGFSDPYCMLGIQPDAEPEAEEGGGGGGGARRIRRLGASFKRRRANSEAAVLPAKFIRTTSVKAATLNPKWHEKFRLDIDDVRSDRLHLDIWDHDDETSVFDAARKLNEVSNLKGLGRYFKEVAQSARTSIGDNVDDFLGCVNIPLEEVSAAGLERWFRLEGRSARSSVQGRIRLKLQLGTREDRGMAAGEDNWREVVEHRQLLWVFVEHELRNFKGPSREWAGDLPQQALTILHQHALQGDITELQQSICQWLAYSQKHRELRLDYALLYQLLEELARTWDESQQVLSMDEEALLAESFHNFADYCMELLLRHRKLFPPANTQAWHKLKFMLKCLSFLYSTSAFKICCPFRNDLHVEVTNTLKRGTLEWMQSLQTPHKRSKKSKSDEFRSLVSLLEALNGDMRKAISHYNHLFESTVKVNYVVLVYKQVEKQVADEIARRIGLQISDEYFTSQNCNEHPNRSYINKVLSQIPETDVFELFLLLQEFSRFRDHMPDEEKASLVLCNCHVWFKDIINHWFALAKSKVRARIYSAVHHDKVRGSRLNLRYSTSAMDTVFCFMQLTEFWRQLAWPDRSVSYPFILLIVQAVASGLVLYCNLIFKKLQEEDSNANQAHLKLSDKVLLSVNNMEHVLQPLESLPKELELEVVLSAVERRQGPRVAQDCRVELDALCRDAREHVLQQIGNVVDSLTQQMQAPIKKFVFHLAWAPEKLDPEKCMSPLLEYLESHLKALYETFLEANFRRLLQSVWALVLAEIATTARTNLGKERPFFFERLSASLAILVQFFHADGKALPLPAVHNAEYQELERELRLQKSDTPHLIELYYLQRIEDQSKLFHSPFGCLSVNAFYEEIKQTVCIEVISARDLIPCDPNGLSDPFVILELVPRHLFPDSAHHKTKIHMKTLSPNFNESFEWPASWEKCRNPAAALSLVVMDYDYMRKNDFEGEAYLPLSGLPPMRREPPHELVLMGPKDTSDILRTLAMRTWDKQAAELLRQEKVKRS